MPTSSHPDLSLPIETQRVSGAQGIIDQTKRLWHDRHDKILQSPVNYAEATGDL